MRALIRRLARMLRRPLMPDEVHTNGRIHRRNHLGGYECRTNR